MNVILNNKEMHIPLSPIPKRRHSLPVTFFLTGQLVEGGRLNLLMQGR